MSIADLRPDERAPVLEAMTLRGLMDLSRELMANQRVCESQLRLDVLTVLTLRLAADVTPP